MDEDIRDTSSDSSSDTIVIDREKDAPTSSTTEELDAIFKKYLLHSDNSNVDEDSDIEIKNDYLKEGKDVVEAYATSNSDDSGKPKSNYNFKESESDSDVELVGFEENYVDEAPHNRPGEPSTSNIRAEHSYSLSDHESNTELDQLHEKIRRMNSETQASNNPANATNKRKQQSNENQPKRKAAEKKEKKTNESKSEKVNDALIEHSYKLSDHESDTELDQLHEKIRHMNSETQASNNPANATNKRKQQSNENQPKRKAAEKKEKKTKESKSENVNDALKIFNKNFTPENCMKFIKVHFDEELSTREYFEEISNNLNANKISFVVGSQTLPNSITWTRHLDTHILDQNVQLIDLSQKLKINEIVHIIECLDFINRIHTNTFLNYVENLQTIAIGKRIILVIYNLQKYFKFLKNKRKHGKTFTDHKIFLNAPEISRRDVENVLTEIQILYSISHKFLETAPELSLFIFQLTKSVAQLPHKQAKAEKVEEAKWFVPEDKKNCVRVDKDGNGLSRLWKQVITIFPMTSLETAEAISNVYPSPLKLMEAYEKISSVEEGEKLLQEIPIRRNAGPISAAKKLGPELSKKMYYFFNSDPNRILF